VNVIDAHAHAYPTVELGEAWQRMMAHEPRRTGQIDELGQSMADAGIERAIVLLWTRGWERHEQLLAEGIADADARATVRGEIDALNEWGCALGASDPRFVPYVGIDVRFLAGGELRAEIERLVALGARGVKLIPPAMRLYANDPLLLPVYEACEALRLPIVSQSGSGGGPAPAPGADHYGSPRFWDDVLGTFPRLQVQLAHLRPRRRAPPAGSARRSPCRAAAPACPAAGSAAACARSRAAPRTGGRCRSRAPPAARGPRPGRGRPPRAGGRTRRSRA
jgi:predicted TIM-barrel fold metal-dependent hydrolase